MRSYRTGQAKAKLTPRPAFATAPASPGFGEASCTSRNVSRYFLLLIVRPPIGSVVARCVQSALGTFACFLAAVPDEPHQRCSCRIYRFAYPARSRAGAKVSSWPIRSPLLRRPPSASGHRPQCKACCSDGADGQPNARPMAGAKIGQIRTATPQHDRGSSRDLA